MCLLFFLSFFPISPFLSLISPFFYFFADKYVPGIYMQAQNPMMDWLFSNWDNDDAYS